MPRIIIQTQAYGGVSIRKFIFQNKIENKNFNEIYYFYHVSIDYYLNLVSGIKSTEIILFFNLNIIFSKNFLM